MPLPIPFDLERLRDPALRQVGQKLIDGTRLLPADALLLFGSVIGASRSRFSP